MISLVLILFGKSPLIDSSSWFSSGKTSTCFIPWSSIVIICSSNALPRREYVISVCYIILLWSDSNFSSLVRNSYLSILPDDNADIFAASLLIYIVVFHLLSSIVMISFYVLSIWFFLKREDLKSHLTNMSRIFGSNRGFWVKDPKVTGPMYYKVSGLGFHQWGPRSQDPGLTYEVSFKFCDLESHQNSRVSSLTFMPHNFQKI